MMKLIFSRGLCIILLVLLSMPLSANSVPVTIEQAKPSGLEAPALIGAGAALSLVGGVLLVQSYPLKTQADIVFAEWVAGTASAEAKDQAAGAFAARYWTGLGIGIAGVIITFIGISKGHGYMDYMIVSPPESALSLSIEGGFLGLRIIP
jgi:hypothetical protein